MQLTQSMRHSINPCHISAGAGGLGTGLERFRNAVKRHEAPLHSPRHIRAGSLEDRLDVGSTTRCETVEASKPLPFPHKDAGFKGGLE
jgi:hypothetical protein